jgi:hypothetical protein
MQSRVSLAAKGTTAAKWACEEPNRLLVSEVRNDPKALRYQFRNCDHLNTHLAERRSVTKFLRRAPMIAHRSYLRRANVIFWHVETCGGILKRSAYGRPRRQCPFRGQKRRFHICRWFPISRELIGPSKLRWRHFDFCRLRRLLSGACRRAVRSTRGRYDRHSSSSASGMEAATDPQYVPREVGPTNRQRAQAARERSNRLLCRPQGRRTISDSKSLVPPLPTNHCDGPFIAGVGIWNQPCGRREAFSE